MSGSTVDSGAESRLAFKLPMRWAKSSIPSHVTVKPDTSGFIMQPSVLIVDTLPPFRAALAHYCEVWGFRVVAVDTLSAARAELRSTFFTVLLISLPSNASDDVKPQVSLPGDVDRYTPSEGSYDGSGDESTGDDGGSEAGRASEPEASHLPVDFEEILDLRSATLLDGTSVVVMSSVNRHHSNPHPSQAHAH